MALCSASFGGALYPAVRRSGTLENGYTSSNYASPYSWAVYRSDAQLEFVSITRTAYSAINLFDVFRTPSNASVAQWNKKDHVEVADVRRSTPSATSS